MRKLFYIIVVLGLISCNTQKGVKVKEKEIKYESLDEEKLFQAVKSPADFSVLKIRATADIEAKSSYPAVNLTLYIDRGRQIWSNATLILPLARASIVPSGFRMYERIGKTYVDSDFDYVNNLLKVDFIDYQSIENLLTGRVFFPIYPQDFNLSVRDNNYLLTSSNLMKVGKGKDVRNFTKELAFDSNFNLKQIILEDKFKDTFLQIDYDNYFEFEGKVLPKNIKIFIKDKKETKISLEYNKFEFVKMDTPFEIPKGYSQRKIN